MHETIPQTCIFISFLNNILKNNLALLSIVALVLGLYFHVQTGENGIGLQDLFSSQAIAQNKWLVFTEFRFPKIIGACLTGAAISVCGLLMQTYFRNPLAGPFVLGISSGASLGVALFLLGSSTFASLAVLGKVGLIGSATLGSAFVLMVVLLSSTKLSQTSNLLIVGLMWASLASSLVSVLEYFASGMEVKSFLIWGMGSLLNLSSEDLYVFIPTLVTALTACFFLTKKLDILLLGKDYAITMGVNFKQLTRIVLVISCVLAGICTAFVGPIAFVGLAIPHFARTWLQTNLHKKLVFHCCFLGAGFMVWCQFLAEHLLTDIILPINIITSIIGAPVVIRILLKNNA